MKKIIFTLATISLFFFISCESKNKSEKINNQVDVGTLDTASVKKNLDEYDLLRKKNLDEYLIIEKQALGEYDKKIQEAYVDYYSKKQKFLIDLCREEEDIYIEFIDLSLLIGEEIQIINSIRLSDSAHKEYFLFEKAEYEKYREFERSLYKKYQQKIKNAYKEYSKKDSLLNKE